MKYLTLLLTPLFVLASEGTLTTSEHNSIHGYNKKPTVKIRQKSNMHRLHEVDEKEAANITKQETNEDVQSIRLTHSGRILKYLVKTENYRLTINALDGTVSDKVKDIRFF